jgi:hypothetical protein
VLVASTTAAPAPAAGSGTLVAPPRAHTFGFRRITNTQLGLVLPGRSFDDPGGIAVTRLLATDGAGRDDDDEVTLVAVDRGGRLFTNFGLLKAGVFTGEGTRLGPLRSPTDAAIDRHGRVAVTDTGNRRVVLLRHLGDRLEAVGAVDGFLEPTGIAADGLGGFLVCDRRFNTVTRIDTDTGDRTTFGLEITFDRPIAIATVPADDRLAGGKRAFVAIVDRDGRRIRTFDSRGSLRASRDVGALLGEGARLDAIDLDFHDNVLGVDRRACKVHKLRDDLYPLDSFGSRGTDEGEFLGPRGIAIHRPLGQVFIAEEDGGQYLWVGTDVRQVETARNGSGVALSYLLTEESFVEIRITEPDGDPVAVLLDGERQTPGPQRGSWDGTDSAGHRVAAGSYLLEIRARATYASRSVWERRIVRTVEAGGNR